MNQTNDHDQTTFASTLLRIAAEVERDESALRDRIAVLIDKGDAARAQRLLSMWRTSPAAEVLRLDAAERLD